jgi:hypothetical protein
MTFTKTQRRIFALEAELEYIYELVEASALTASPDEIADLYDRSRVIVALIAALRSGAVSA